MSHCCTGKGHSFGRYSCPANGKEYPEINLRTVLHQIKKPWDYPLPAPQHYFCYDPECDVVYFTHSGAVINRQQLRGQVGQKERSPDRMLCYCYGVLQNQAATDPSIKSFVIMETKAGRCACEVRNPSGRCCLKDFPKGSD